MPFLKPQFAIIPMIILRRGVIKWKRPFKYRERVVFFASKLEMFFLLVIHVRPYHSSVPVHRVPIQTRGVENLSTLSHYFSGEYSSKGTVFQNRQRTLLLAKEHFHHSLETVNVYATSVTPLLLFRVHRRRKLGPGGGGLVKNMVGGSMIPPPHTRTNIPYLFPL